MTHRQNTAKTSKSHSSRQATARSQNDALAEYCKTLKMSPIQNIIKSPTNTAAEHSNRSKDTDILQKTKKPTIPL